MPTSIAGNNASPARRGSGGFTLLELLFVLVIVGLASTLAISNVSRLASRSGETSLVDNIVRELKQARIKAILSGMPNQIEVQYEAGMLVSTDPNRPPVRLPERYAFKPQDEAMLDKTQSITFYPDGSATQSTFRLSTPERGGYDIRINGLTGHVGAQASGRG